MKLKNILILAILGLLSVSCQVGPTYKMPNGGFLTLGADFANKGTGDARTATLPDKTKLSWVRNTYDNASVPNNAITLGIPAIQFTKAVQSNNALKAVQSTNATNQAISVTNATGAAQQAAIGTAAKAGTVVPVVVGAIK